MKHYIVAGLIGLLAAAPAKAKECTGAEISGICFNLEHALIGRAVDAGSEKIFAVVYELHTSPAMRENVFLTIEEMINENNAGFLAMEYFQGEVSFDADECRFVSSPGLYYNTRSIFAAIGCQPEEYRQDDARHYAVIGPPVGTASLFELIYEDDLLTFGMDDWGLRRRAHAVGRSMASEADVAVYDDIINRQRSIAFIQHIEEYVVSHDAGNVLIVSAGLNHRESLEAELEKKGYSYLSIVPYEINIEE
ncbi:MAG: hypothetical protein KJ955_02560 [Nanoarchaeota archaeon]|nr:hypothetical protein [Nanoarchaeota archaeon]